MPERHLDPKTITKPIQLLAAWFATLVLIVGAFLTGASTITTPAWASAMLTIAAVAIVPVFAGCVLLLQVKYRTEILADDAYLKVKTFFVDGVTKSIERSLRSGSEKERAETADGDLPKLQFVTKSQLNSAHGETDHMRKLGDIVAEIGDPSAWIDDSVFVSGTYGYNVWPGEMEAMQREELIEVEGQRVRLTEKGVKLAEEYNRSRQRGQ